ncbi:DNA polymerase III subunit epsilon [Vibrio genomosp. F10]|uniref:DNA polymerase III subunit epsilon n=2 Tax=Vibrio genomosp. F10 TaxID=723171 RepID=A0A1B9R1E9_9VIBR|nr:DNA polymerase III subunit epsilon [Vibrio genomosp. F10]OCH77968.1 DNA polymerase III subunit epsilon [Vibrio genomosp. F10]OEE38442.1 DNA polymerase III subunit epsilon [Vibrio genomosp. F10 str. ZF-129]OEE93319.1 DNA polymerase III subunit epsilon [Vibrio genomosp. F10 str. 9ZC157]OEF09164.1 DNA polymerase III subunit epsilon [Vibrio genomosp. F10 str. 9ZB36]
MNTSSNLEQNVEQKRIIVLDTETTGMNREGGPTYQGHRIIEIGAVEIIGRKLTGRHFHVYIKPDREIQPDAIEVHGITDEFLSDKPSYSEVHQEFIEFIKGAELVAHNAPFDVGFMDHEFRMFDSSAGQTTDYCEVTDTLAMAKRMPNMPARKNLDSLAKHYTIDTSARILHGALLDAEILADVYLAMTGGQTSLQFSSEAGGISGVTIKRINTDRKALKVLLATADEVKAHQERLDIVQENGNCLWLK